MTDRKMQRTERVLFRSMADGRAACGEGRQRGTVQSAGSGSRPGEKEVHPGADLWKISCIKNGSEIYHTLREGMTPEEYGIGKARAVYKSSMGLVDRHAGVR